MKANLVLDLHGVKHADVVHTLENFFFWDNPTKHRSVEIITGNSLEMKRLVTTWLDKYDYVYFSPHHNLGTIFVTSNQNEK